MDHSRCNADVRSLIQGRLSVTAVAKGTACALHEAWVWILEAVLGLGRGDTEIALALERTTTDG